MRVQKAWGASIERKHKNTWHTIAFASRFLNEHESKYSTNELELLAVVWSLEHFKHYLYGTEFTLQTDHRALLSALNENRGNKTNQSRLTRWVDRLLPFNFELELIPGKNMGFADYLSRHPKKKPSPPSEDDTKYTITSPGTYQKSTSSTSNRINFIRRRPQRSNWRRISGPGFSTVHSRTDGGLGRCEPHNLQYLQPNEKFVSKQNTPRGNMGRNKNDQQPNCSLACWHNIPEELLNSGKSKRNPRRQPQNSTTALHEQNTIYRWFNNNNIKVEGTQHLTLQSGSWTNRNCQVLVDRHKTNNLMGRLILQKLGTALQQRPKQSPGNNINSISYIETEKISSSGYLENTHNFACESANQKTTSLYRFSNKITPPTNKKEEGYHYTYSKK